MADQLVDRWVQSMVVSRVERMADKMVEPRVVSLEYM